MFDISKKKHKAKINKRITRMICFN